MIFQIRAIDKGSDLAVSCRVVIVGVCTQGMGISLGRENSCLNVSQSSSHPWQNAVVQCYFQWNKHWSSYLLQGETSLPGFNVWVFFVSLNDTHPFSCCVRALFHVACLCRTALQVANFNFLWLFEHFYAGCRRLQISVWVTATCRELKMG